MERDRDDMERALDIIATHQELATFAGPREEADLLAAEQALGLTFPPTYRRFVHELGAGSFGAEEFYGVLTSDLTRPGVPNGIWSTLRQRAEFGLPSYLVYVYNLGDGTKYYLDTARTDESGECPVVAFHGVPQEGDTAEVVADNFGEFFFEMIELALENEQLDNG